MQIFLCVNLLVGEVVADLGDLETKGLMLRTAIEGIQTWADVGGKGKHMILLKDKTKPPWAEVQLPC